MFIRPAARLVLAIPFLFSGATADRMKVQYEPSDFVFFLSVTLKEPPVKLDTAKLAQDIVQSIAQQAPTFDIQATPSGVRNPCARKKLCDRVTLVESVFNAESPYLQFALLIQPGEKTGKNWHKDIPVPIDEISCDPAVLEAASWRQCPHPYARRIFLELKKHLSESHPQTSPE
jgi:hypothetical protein